MTTIVLSVIKSLVCTLTTLQTIWLATLLVYWNIYVILRGRLIRSPYLISSYSSYTINNLLIKSILSTEQCSGSIFTDSGSRLCDEPDPGSGSKSKFYDQKFKNFSWKQLNFYKIKIALYLFFGFYEELSNYSRIFRSAKALQTWNFSSKSFFPFLVGHRIQSGSETLLLTTYRTPCLCRKRSVC